MNFKMDNQNLIIREINLIKKSLFALEKHHMALGGWMPQKAVMRFFDYGDNRLRKLEKEGKLKVSKVGRRKFYSIDSIIKMLEENKEK